MLRKSKNTLLQRSVCLRSADRVKACLLLCSDRQDAKASLIEGKEQKKQGYASSYDEGVGGQVLDLSLKSGDIQGSYKLQS